jgi:hypothetical protein
MKRNKDGSIRKQKNFCVLPTCSRCSIRLHNGNTYKQSNGRFISHCKQCNKDRTIIKAWKKKSIEEINNQICKYYYLIDLLEEAIEEKTDKLKKERSN